MVENRKKHRQNSHPIINCPTSEGVSERANGRASGPVLQSVFLAVLDHNVPLASLVSGLAGRAPWLVVVVPGAARRSALPDAAVPGAMALPGPPNLAQFFGT